MDRQITNEVGAEPVPEDVSPEQTVTVGLSRGLTVNLGNYESARIDCWCSRPCKAGEEEQAYEKCYEFVTGKIKDAVSKLKKRK